MKRFYYLLAILFAVIWLLNFFVFHAGAMVKFFVMPAIVCYLHGLIITDKTKYENKNTEEETIANAA
jgi:hypothetical protein